MQYAISGKTRFGGLLGSPVAHSLSPAMHNASFQKLGIDCVYLAFDVTQERLEQTVRVLRELNVFGFNLTMPCKKTIIGMLDGLSTAARLIGAVNTVVNQDGKLIGHNTDGIGYVESHFWEPAGLQRQLPFRWRWTEPGRSISRTADPGPGKKPEGWWIRSTGKHNARRI